MRFCTFSAAALSLFSTSVFAAFDAASNKNVVAYFGQADNQPDLKTYCDTTDSDIIVLGFLNYFFDQGKGGYPQINFGNKCWADPVYIAPGNVTTGLYLQCPSLPGDITYCQGKGKKIMLSLGGDNPDGAGKQIYAFSTEAQGTKMANFLWEAFGPPALAPADGPRPLGDVTLDGFDLDIEGNGPTGYTSLIKQLRVNYAKDASRKYYISAAPQCPIPDANLGSVITASNLDFVWVQFYNNPACNAANWFSQYVSTKAGFNFDKWSALLKSSANPAAKLYLGIPGSSPSGAGYVDPVSLANLISYLQGTYSNFGGVMAWDITSATSNTAPDGISFLHKVKAALVTPIKTYTTMIVLRTTSVAPRVTSVVKVTTKIVALQTVKATSTVRKTSGAVGFITTIRTTRGLKTTTVRRTPTKIITSTVLLRKTYTPPAVTKTTTIYVSVTSSFGATKTITGTSIIRSTPAPLTATSVIRSTSISKRTAFAYKTTTVKSTITTRRYSTIWVASTAVTQFAGTVTQTKLLTTTSWTHSTPTVLVRVTSTVTVPAPK